MGQKNVFVEYMEEVGLQTWILLKKNFLLYTRRWQSTLLQLLVPMVAAFIILGLAKSGGSQTSTLYPDAVPTGMIPACKSYEGRTCYALAWAFNASTTEAEVLNVINIVQTQNNLGSSQIKKLDNEAALASNFKENINTTVAGVVFYSLAGGKLSYNLYLNTSVELAPLASTYQVAIDNALLRYSTGATKDLLSISKQGYPKLPNFVNNEIVAFSVYGSLFFFVAVFFQFTSLLQSVVAEKENSLRLGMSMMGLREIAFWLSWYITATVIAALAALLAVIAGVITRLDFFVNSDFGIVFAVFWLFGMAMIPFAFFFSSFLASTRTANTVGFIVLVIGALFQFSAGNSFAIYSFWDPSGSSALRYVFMFYPPFNFAKAFSDISRVSLRKLNAVTGTYETPQGFHAESLTTFQEVTGDIIRPSVRSHVPATGQAMLFQLMNFCIYAFLTWYFDNVFGGSGVRKEPWFFLTREYWGLHAHHNSAAEQVQIRQDDDLDVAQEAKLTHSTPIEDPESKAGSPRIAVQIMNLVKEFSVNKTKKKKKSEKDGKNKKDGEKQPAEAAAQAEEEEATIINGKKRAVDGLSFMIDSNSCFGMLGHNGAGKTTMISMLVGLFPPTSGDAFVFGKSIRREMAEVRKMMGVCPQYDILWPELTAREHLQIFAEFKGVRDLDKINQEIDDRLKDVNLFSVGDRAAGTYSGGMKRRLSVAISFIGNPKIIFLDEPTTGMDPASRRQVWELIQRMKKGRVVVLTTHSMEEADALADRISIMGRGRLRCIGDSLHLKSRFGNGYNISLVCEVSRVNEILQTVRTYLPTATLVASNAGNLMFNYTPVAQDQDALPRFISVLEGYDGSIVRDFGISQTTLEEVFIRITKESHYNVDTDQNQKLVSPRSGQASSSQPASPSSRPPSAKELLTLRPGSPPIAGTEFYKK